MRRRKVDLSQLRKILKDEPDLNFRQIADRMGVNRSTIYRNIPNLPLSSSNQNFIFKMEEPSDLDANKRLSAIVEIVQNELNYIRAFTELSSGKERREWDELLLKFIGEVRKQLDLQLNIFNTLWNIEQAKQFQEVVLQVLEETDEKIRKTVLERLREKRFDRRVVKQG